MHTQLVALLRFVLTVGLSDFFCHIDLELEKFIFFAEKFIKIYSKIYSMYDIPLYTIKITIMVICSKNTACQTKLLIISALLLSVLVRQSDFQFCQTSFVLRTDHHNRYLYDTGVL